MSDTSWTQERIDTAITLFRAGLPASRIADKLGGGATRNAVLGKLHRMGIVSHAPYRPPRKKPERTEAEKPKRATPSMPVVRQPALPRPKALVVLPPTPVELVDGRITIATLETGMCKWPIGDPGTDDFCFCGHAQREGSPYCRYHAEKAYSGSVTNQNLKRSTRDNVILKLAAR